MWKTVFLSSQWGEGLNLILPGKTKIDSKQFVYHRSEEGRYYPFGRRKYDRITSEFFLISKDLFKLRYFSHFHLWRHDTDLKTVKLCRMLDLNRSSACVLKIVFAKVGCLIELVIPMYRVNRVFNDRLTYIWPL